MTNQRFDCLWTDRSTCEIGGMVSCRLSVSWVLPSYFIVLHEPCWLGRPISATLLPPYHFVLFGCLGCPSRYRDTWSRQSPSWYQDSKSSQASGYKSPEGYREWSHQDNGNRRCELQWEKQTWQTWEATGDKILSAPPADLRHLQKNLHKKKRLSQTYKKNTEANARVYDLYQKTMKAFETLAFLHCRFETSG